MSSFQRHSSLLSSLIPAWICSPSDYSQNAYIVQNNALALVALWMINYLIPFIFRFFYLRLIKYLLVAFFVGNITWALRGSIQPYFSTIQFPYKDYLFAPGPFVSALLRFYRCLFPSSNITTPASAPAAQPAKFTTSTASDAQQRTSRMNDREFVSSFSSTGTKTLFDQQQQQASFFKPNATASAANHYNASSPFAAADLNTAPGMSFSETANAGFSTTAAAPEVPKLRYAPCVRPPPKPTTHRERLLWYLSPTPEIIEDFRIEQNIEFQKQWCAFNDRSSRPYYEKLTDILLTKMFRPLSKAIDTYNQCLAPKGYTVANCPLSTVVLSMMLPSNIDTAFTLPDVESFISVDSFGDVESRRYVIERIKELASSTKMAGFRFTPKTPGLPTDSAIILHIFKYYLSIKEPYAIPPLILPEGDIFKFLLIYIKITPELSHWKLFD